MSKARHISAAVILAVFLIVCNLTFAPSAGWARLVWNSIGYAGLYAIYRFAKLRKSDIGLSRATFMQGVRIGIITIGCIALVLVAAFMLDRHSFQDARYHHTITTALYASLVLLPAKTILFEEIAFRGMLPALLLHLYNRQSVALLGSAFAFGLWHIATATSIGGYDPGKLLSVLAVFAFTSAAGAILYLLRLKSDSLIAPILVHWFTNGASIMLAAYSWR
jgi:membrane protease YdiL (CAAX protease family)